MQMGRDCCGSRFRFSQDEGVASVRNVGTAAAHRAAHHGPRAGPFRHPHGGRGRPGGARRRRRLLRLPVPLSAIAGATDPDPEPRPLPPARLTGQPGSRAPHLQVTVDHRRFPPWTCTAAASPQVPAAGYRFGVELTPPPGRPPTASGPGSAAGPARRLRRLAQHRPAPRPHHRARGRPPRPAEHPRVGAQARVGCAPAAGSLRARPSPPGRRRPMLSSCAHEPARGSQATGGAPMSMQPPATHGHRRPPAAQPGGRAAAPLPAGPARRGSPSHCSPSPSADPMAVPSTSTTSPPSSPSTGATSSGSGDATLEFVLGP